jgi:HEAT repeat protein
MSMLNLLARNRIKFHTEQIEITDTEAIDQVRALFTHDDPDHVVNALSIARRIKGVDLVPEVMTLTSHLHPRVRAAAAGFIAELGGPDQVGRMTELVRVDSDPGVRAKAAQAVFRLGDAASYDNYDITRPYLDDPDLSVRAVALSIFLESEREEERLLGNEILDRMAGSDNAEERLAALDAVIGQKAQTCTTTVLAALEDPAPEVSCRAALAATAVNCPGVWEVLLQRLRDNRIRPMELTALGTADDGVVPQLREILNDTTLPIQVRRNAAQSLGRIGGDASLEVLLERLHKPLLTVLLEAARAASRILRGQGRSLPRERVSGALELLYDDAYQITAALADFDQSPLRDHVGLATVVLRRRLKRGIDTLFVVLGMTYPADVIDLAVASMNSTDKKQLDTATEVLHQALEREDRGRVIPLIESESPAASLEAAGKRVDVIRRDGEERIERWLRHADPWRSTAALWTTADAHMQQLREKVRVHLQSDHAVVRETAALAAWKIEDSDGRRRLLEPLLNDPVKSIRDLVENLFDRPADPSAKRPA